MSLILNHRGDDEEIEAARPCLPLLRARISGLIGRTSAANCAACARRAPAHALDGAGWIAERLLAAAKAALVRSE